MPIRPENKARYPKNWPDIRLQILARAGEQRNKAGEVMGEAKCEWCGVVNHSFGTRKANGDWQPMDLMEADAAHLDGERVVQIILTIAHVHDHAPENCDPANLAALCQRCHNRHDAPHRRSGRRERQAANTSPLFGGAPMTRRVESTHRLPSGALMTLGVDVAIDGGEFPDRLAEKLAVFLALRAGAIVGAHYGGSVQHQRGPFGVPIQGTQP